MPAAVSTVSTVLMSMAFPGHHPLAQAFAPSAPARPTRQTRERTGGGGRGWAVGDSRPLGRSPDRRPCAPPARSAGPRLKWPGVLIWSVGGVQASTSPYPEVPLPPHQPVIPVIQPVQSELPSSASYEPTSPSTHTSMMGESSPEPEKKEDKEDK